MPNKTESPTKEIIITITHPDKNKTEIDGFASFWGQHVVDFDTKEHCQACLVGPKEWSKQKLKGKINTDAFIVPMKGQYFYICGVKSNHDKDYNNNFHLAIEYKEGAEAELTTYNGFKIAITNAKQIRFDFNQAWDNHLKKGRKYVTCRIYWFALQEHRNIKKEQKD